MKTLFIPNLAQGESPIPQVMKKMRNFMESLARRKNMDPLLPETWHNIPYETVYQYRVKFQSFIVMTYLIYRLAGLY
jgi:hypothetical protein